MNRGGLRPAETRLIIQASIMEFSPQQVLLRDKILTYVEEATTEQVDDLVRTIGAKEASVWVEIMRQAADEVDALKQLLMIPIRVIHPHDIYVYVV